MLIYLYKVNSGLNRCIRTAFSFGFCDIFLFECGEFDKRLFSTTITIHRVNYFPPDEFIILEKGKGKDIKKINFNRYNSVIIGGESVTLNKKICDGDLFHIKTKNNLCLTTPVALGIFLWELYNADNM